jgi:hypothetical protein
MSCNNRLKPTEIYKLVSNTGRGDSRRWNNLMATAVVLAESGGCADTQNPSGATGLFQIMPSTAQGLGRDPSMLTDPNYNVNTAFLLWRSNIKNGKPGWWSWATVYDQSSHKPTGLYKKYISTAMGAAGGDNPGESEAVGTGVLGTGVGPDIGANASEDVKNAITSVPSFLSAFWNAVTSGSFWLRLALGLGGILALAMGIWILSKSFMTSVQRKVR